MRNLSNSDRPFSKSETFGYSGNITNAFAGKAYYWELINKANSVPILNIFRYYGVYATIFNRKMTCPFPAHKGGREKTPSFWYYPSTNSFCCYGCNAKGGCCEFVMSMEDITRTKAAKKIIALFGNDIGEIDISDQRDFSETLSLMGKFSTVVRQFRQELFDEKSLFFINTICRVYDSTNNRHRLDNMALKVLIFDLIEEIDAYKICK